MIEKVPPRVLENFRDTGKLPIIYHILTSENKIKIQNFYNVFEKFGLVIADFI